MAQVPPPSSGTVGLERLSNKGSVQGKGRERGSWVSGHGAAGNGRGAKLRGERAWHMPAFLDPVVRN